MGTRSIRTVICAIVATVLFLPGSAHAQGLSANSFQNWNFLGAGARARGMAGAFLAVSDDGTASTWNPAGLIYNEGVLMTANYSLSRVGLGLDNTPLGPMDLPTNDRSSSSNLSNLSSATFLAPLTVREHEFFLSVHYNRVQDVFARGEFEVDDADSTVRPVIFGAPLRTQFSLGGNISYVGAAFGTVVAQNLSVGANLNLVTGDGAETHNMVLDSTRYSVFSDNPDVIDSIHWQDRSDLDYSGLNFAVSAMYRTDRWSAGLVFTPGWTLTQNLDYRGTRTDFSTSLNEGTEPRAIVPGPDGTNREIQIPYTVGLGGAYNINENLLVALDYQFRAFKREGEIRFEDDPVTPGSPLERMPTTWYNLHQVRVGLEYLKETNWGMIPLRLGVRNDPLLIGDNTGAVLTFDQRAGQKDRGTERTPREDGVYFLPLTTPGATGDQINTLTFAIGSGVHWSQIHLDFALEFMGYEYNETGRVRMIRLCDDCDPNDPRLDPNDVWGNNRATFEFGDYRRTYKDNRVRFSLNFTGYF